MTWVVGASSFMGYGLMASDVRISFADGTEADMLRKAYPVGPYLLAGFAGSVAIGLSLIDSLQRALRTPDHSAAGAWRPEWVAEQWSPIAAKLFEAAPSAEQDGGSQILMVGVSPVEDMGVPEFPRVYVTRFEWPDFAPSHMEKGLSVCHIGSGADVEAYETGIAGHFELGSPAMMAGVQAGPGGALAMIGSGIRHVVSDKPEPGISPHVFVDAVALGRFWSGTNDQTRHYPDGRIVEFAMPKVASTYSEFLHLCQTRGKASARAIG